MDPDREIEKFAEEYRAYAISIGLPDGGQIADDMANALRGILLHGNENADAIKLFDRVLAVIRSKRPFKDRLHEYGEIMRLDLEAARKGRHG